MQAVCQLLNIDKMRTTAYKASTNAAIERFHRTLNAMLGKVISEHQRDWDSYLPFVMAAYRASRHEATGYSPNYLVFARENRAPVDIVMPQPEEEDTPESYDSYVERMNERLREAYKIVSEHIGQAAERNKKYYDLRVRPRKFAVGDWVYYYNPRHYKGRQDKWSRKFIGPMLVVKVLPPVNVQLQKSKNASPFISHIDKVKPFYGDPPRSWLTDAPVEQQSLGDGETSGSQTAIEASDQSPVGEADTAEQGEAEPRNRRRRQDLPRASQQSSREGPEPYEADQAPEQRPRREINCQLDTNQKQGTGRSGHAALWMGTWASLPPRNPPLDTSARTEQKKDRQSEIVRRSRYGA